MIKAFLQVLHIFSTEAAIISLRGGWYGNIINYIEMPPTMDSYITGNMYAKIMSFCSARGFQEDSELP